MSQSYQSGVIRPDKRRMVVAASAIGTHNKWTVKYFRNEGLNTFSIK